VRRSIDALQLRQQWRVVVSEAHSCWLQVAHGVNRSLRDLNIDPIQIVDVYACFRRRWPPQSQGVGTLMNVCAGHDEVRSRRSLSAEYLSNLLDVVVEKADQVRRAQNHGLPGSLQRQAANVKRIMNRGCDSVMAKSRQVDCSSGEFRRDHGLRRSHTD